MDSNSVLRAWSKAVPESWDAAKKSSMYTSVKLSGGLRGPWLRVVGGGMPWKVVGVGAALVGSVRAVSLRPWLEAAKSLVANRALARSAMVSVTAQR
jgi:hypothetical protein